jgi:uncharacterized membrane protein
MDGILPESSPDTVTSTTPIEGDRLGRMPETPPAPPPEDIPATYKRVFIRGVATLLPTVLTLWVIVAGYGFVQGKIAEPTSTFMKERLLATEAGNHVAVALLDIQPASLADPIPQDGSLGAAERESNRRKYLKEEIEKKFPSWAGFVIAILGVFVVGFFISGIVGRTVWQLVEGWLSHVPIVKSVYPGAKQMVEFFLKSEESRRSWSSVVAVEYPRKGIWAVGYITGPGISTVEERAGETLRTVFLPASPTMAGYVIMVPEREIVTLDMTVDDAIKFTISGGVVRPVKKSPSERLRQEQQPLTS